MITINKKQIYYAKKSLNDQIRVLFVISELGLGGEEKQMVELVTGFDKSLVDARVIVFKKGGERQEILKKAGISVIVVNRKWKRIWAIIQEYRAFRPHLIQAFSIIAGIYSSLAVQFVKNPILLSAFNASHTVKRVAVAQWLLSRFMNKIVCNSEKGRKYLQESCRVHPQRLMVIRNGFDFNFSNDKFSKSIGLRSELGIKPNQLLVGIIGKLNLDKDPMLIARAAVEVFRKVPNSIFCFIGSGHLLGSVQDFLKKNKIDDRFFLIPQRSDAPWLAREFDIGVLCSCREGFPNVILEYTYWSKPCVVTDAGDCRNIVEDGRTGYVIQIGKSDEMAEAIVKLLKDKNLRKKFGKAGRQKLEDEFHISRYVNEFYALYQKLLKLR